MVAGNYFDVLGVSPHLGRMLTPDDDREIQRPPRCGAAVRTSGSRNTSHGRGVIGEAVRLNDTPFTVVGSVRLASPAKMSATNQGFVPVAMQPTIAPTNPRLNEPRAAWFYPFARLKPGVTLMQAEAAMKVLYRQRQEVELGQSYFSRFPEARGSLLRQTFTLEPGDRGASGLRTRYERPLILLEWLAAAVLLIACANIAGLLAAAPP